VPDVGATRPAAHGVHALACGADHVPGAHGAHAALSDVAALDVPAAHAAHTVTPVASSSPAVS
jgi:hypothetical protein